MKLKYHTEQFDGVQPFEFFINYSEITRSHPKNVHDSHVHKECELYVNLGGDVSFEVGDKIYPILHGDIIFVRPYEYHHCIYHSGAVHKFFWILFPSVGNEFLFNDFFARVEEDGNRFSLSEKDTEELVALCHSLTETQPSSAAKYSRFFRLVELLQSAATVGDMGKSMPPDVVKAIDRIGKNFEYQISVKDLAKDANVSINTLERHFVQSLGLSPREYIKKKRLANAAKLLAEGYSVAQASESSGFSDYSSFIANFKKYYKITPFRYKKSLGK